MSQRIPAGIGRIVRDRAKDCCEYCLLPQSSQEATFHIDHILPRVQGGETVDGNLALACVTCSLKKGARTEIFDEIVQPAVRIFDPRTQIWGEHFHINDDLTYRGLTATGRITIDALALNRVRIVSIRHELNLLGRFPPS